MRRFAWIVGWGLVLWGMVSGIASAQPAVGTLRPTSTADARAAQGLGQLVVRDSSGALCRLPIARYHAHVVLHPPVALVQIDQSFYNPLAGQAEGTFVFNLPRGASVSRFAMFVTHRQLIEGELVDRQRATTIYESIVYARRDPALLEQIGDNLFKMRVFPIPPADTKRVLLDYTLPLESDDGQYRFELPLASDLDPIGDFQVTGVIRGPTSPDSAACPSHPQMRIEQRREDEIALSWNETNYRPQSDLALRFSQPLGTTPRLRSYTAETLRLARVEASGREVGEAAGRAATYFLVSIPPEGHSQTPAPADVVVLADTSAAIRNQNAARQAVSTILGNLRPQDRFRLACVDVACRWLTPEWTAAGTHAREAVLKRFDRELFLGQIDIEAALREAVKAVGSAPSGRRRVVVYVGNASPPESPIPAAMGADPSNPFGATSRATDSRMGAIAVMSDEFLAQFERTKATFVGVIVDRKWQAEEMLDRLARRWGGLLFDAGRRQGREELLAWLRAGLPSPERIIDIEVQGTRADDLFVPTAWVPGRALNLLGRSEPTGAIEVKLTRSRGGKPVVQRWTLDVDRSQDDVFLGRLWAQRKLDRLQGRDTVGDPSVGDKVRQQILDLSQEWSLLTPHTAFLVLESEQEYVSWGVPRQLRRRYWKPPEALVALPRPPGEPRPVAAKPTAPAIQEQERVAQAVRSAAQAIEVGNYALAHDHLQSVRQLPAAARSAEYRNLVRQVEAHRQATVLSALGPHGWLLTPGRPEADRFVPDFSPLAAGITNPEFLRRHPHAQRLLQPIRVEPATVTVEQLARLLSDRTGVQVLLDRKALDDAGADAESPFDVRVLGNMSLRAYVRFALQQRQLALLEEPHRLLITTPEEAGSHATTAVYPVGDLLLPGRTAEVSQLVLPYFDVELAAYHRIRQKLRQPVTAKYREVPLGTVVSEVARTLGDNVAIDEKALADAGIKLESPVTASWSGVPLGESLRWILKPLGLTYCVRDEALVITTPEEAEQMLRVRLHSGRGLLYEPKPEALARWNARWGGGSFGGVGGNFGGMAGFGGFMAGTGGGMGGMGGMGGGFGGMGGMTFGGRPGASPVPVRAQAVAENSLSSGGEAIEASPVAPAEPEGGFFGGGDTPGPNVANTTPAVDRQPRDAAALDAGGPAMGPSGGTMIDFDSAIDLITTTIRPTAWDAVGGPASIAVFQPTLDFVVAATDDVHDEIAALLDRLRRMRPDPEMLKDFRPAEIRADGVQGRDRFDFDSLVDIITSIIEPTTWDEVGGPGSIAVDEVRAALIVSQTDEVHDQVWGLLTQLRRSRYEALRGSRPWETGGAERGPWVAARSGPRLSADSALARLPEPGSDELKLLSVRRDSADGLAEWRRLLPDGQEVDRFSYRRTGGRLEMELPGWTIRTEGDSAAVAYPTLLLVELGPWGESARRLLDARLPWLSHRTNVELARLFEVRPAPARADDARQGVVRLRFGLAGYADTSRTYLEAAFSKQTGQPVAWESHVDGQLTQRLRFETGATTPPPGGRVVVRLENPAGKTLVRWELIESAAGGPAVHELAAGWPGYVRLDHRHAPPEIDAAFHRGVQAVREGDWPAAVTHLTAALDAHPHHPMILLLLAYSAQQREGLVPRARVLGWLSEVAASPAVDLARFIARGHVPGLTPGERYAILLRQPVESRTASDWELLGRTALEGSRFDHAREHAEAALRAKPEPAQACALEKLRIEALVGLGKRAEAARALQTWSETPGRSSGQIVAMADLAAQRGLREAAVRLYEKALAEKAMPAGSRRELLRRKADAESGLARWRSLLAAAMLLPEQDPRRAEEVRVMLDELQEPGDAAAAEALAAEAPPAIRGAILQRQAELTPDPRVAAEILWKAQALDRGFADRTGWWCQTWNHAERPQWVIQFLERQRREGANLTLGELVELERAYRAVGRPTDAQRAATTPPAPPPAVETPPLALPPLSPGSPASPRSRARGGRMGGGFF